MAALATLYIYTKAPVAALATLYTYTKAPVAAYARYSARICEDKAARIVLVYWLRTVW